MGRRGSACDHQWGAGRTHREQGKCPPGWRGGSDKSVVQPVPGAAVQRTGRQCRTIWSTDQRQWPAFDRVALGVRWPFGDRLARIGRSKSGPPGNQGDRKSVVKGKSVSVRVDQGGRLILQKKKDK